uniref:Uncharacterized protein n=1 Tax=Anguilla anguilla TaxID=7936 RepID=A0A0E9TTL9_ANGAN
MKLCLRKRLQISAERRSVGGICEFSSFKRSSGVNTSSGVG